jgi:hypothetical protein
MTIGKWVINVKIRTKIWLLELYLYRLKKQDHISHENNRLVARAQSVPKAPMQPAVDLVKDDLL